ncbi:hypothetical protein D3C86_2082190 [compost metagenome]
MFESRNDFLVYDFVGLCEVSSALGVTDDDILNAKVFQHHAADFTCERAVIFKVKVLCANVNVCTFCSFNKCR